MKSKLPTHAWGYVILPAAALSRIRPITYHTYSLLQLFYGNKPDIFHLRTFGCAVYVPIAPSKHNKVGDICWVRVLIYNKVS